MASQQLAEDLDLTDSLDLASGKLSAGQNARRAVYALTNALVATG